MSAKLSYGGLSFKIIKGQLKGLPKHTDKTSLRISKSQKLILEESKFWKMVENI